MSTATDSAPTARRAIAANAARLAGSRFVGDALAFLVFLVVARRLGPEGTGTYAHAFAVAGIVAVVANPALADLGVRDMARRTGDAAARYFRSLLTAQAALLGLALLGLGFFLYRASDGPGSTTAILAASAYLGGLMLGRTFFVPAFATENAGPPALAETVCRALAVAAALVWLTLPGTGLAAALLPFAVGGIAYLAWAMIWANRSGFTPLGPREAGGVAVLTRAVVVVGAAEILSQVFIRVEVLLLDSLLGPAPTGVFAAGLKLVEVGLAPMLYLAFAALPRLSRHAESDSTALARTLLRSGVFLAGGLALALLFGLPIVVEPVFGARFAGTGRIAPWLALMTLLFGFEVVLVRLTLAADRQRLYLILLAALTALRLLLSWLLIPRFGIDGALAGACLSLLLLTLGLGVGARDRLPLTHQLATALRVLAATGVAAAVGALVLPLGGLVACAVVGLVYLVAAVPLRLLDLAELRALAGRPDPATA